MALGSIIAGALAPVVVEKIADGIKYRQDKRNARKKTTAQKKKPAPKPAKMGRQLKREAQKKRKENIKKKQIGKVSKKKIDFI